MKILFNRLKNVLLVDDDPDFRIFFRLLLERFSLSIKAFHDGIEAIDHLMNNKVDLIITDFRVPRVNGFELLNWCRERKIHAPILFTTAEGQLFKAEEIALDDCCSTLLKKPIDVKLLGAALTAANRFDHHRDCVHGSFKFEYAKALGERSSIHLLNPPHVELNGVMR